MNFVSQGCRTESSLSGGKSMVLELGPPEEEEVRESIFHLPNTVISCKLSLISLMFLSNL